MSSQQPTNTPEKGYINRRLISEGRYFPSEQLSDDEFVEWLCRDWSAQKCIALFAESGAGKSALWQYLAFRMEQKHPEVEISTINSVTSTKNIEDLLDKTQKVVVFLDAFEELKEENVVLILESIKMAQKNSSEIKFLINSAASCRKKIEKNLSIIEIALMPFDSADRRGFLKSLWKAEDCAKFDEYFKDLSYRIDFTGMPLTVIMLAKIFQDSYERFTRTSTEVEPELALPEAKLDLISVYEQFFKKCIEDSLSEKWEEHQMKSVAQNYQLIAMKQLELEDFIEENCEIQLNEEVDHSLILKTTSETIHFQHQSHAEYFCARYLSERIKMGCASIPGEKLGAALEKQPTIRLFFLKMLDFAFSAGQSDPLVKQRCLITVKGILEKVEQWACEANCSKLLSFIINRSNVYSLRKSFPPHAYKGSTTLLHMAAKSNACKAMVVLLNAPGDIDTENTDGRTPLCVACQYGHLDVVQLLVERGANVNQAASGSNPLHFAVSRPDIVRLLLQKGALVDQTSYQQKTVLHIAARMGNLKVVEELIKCGANVNIADKYEKAPLDHGAYGGDAKVVRLLVQNGALVDQVDYQQRTALHFAVRKGNSEVVGELIDCGANVYLQDKYGRTALHYAASEGRVKVVQVLIQKWALVDQVDWKEETALHIAVRMGHLEVVKELITGGANFNLRNKFEKTPLDYGPYGSIMKVSEWLFQNEDYYKHPNREGYSKVVMKVKEKNEKSSQHCEETGGNDQQEIGLKVLQTAAFEGNLEAVKELIKCGTNINMQDKYGRTALHYGASGGDIKVVQFLIQEGALVDQVDHQQETALHIAILTGHSEVVKELIKCSANVNMQGIHKTYLDVLSKRRRQADIF